MRMCPALSSRCYPRSNGSSLTTHIRVEHGDVKVVAVNDPFIEPHYAVRLPPEGTRVTKCI